jgi:hypothetical protein
MAPEHPLDVGQKRFFEVSSGRRGPYFLIADANVERCFCWVHNDICAITAQFAIDLVTDINSHGNHGSSDCDSEGHGHSGQQLSSLLPPERLI